MDSPLHAKDGIRPCRHGHRTSTLGKGLGEGSDLESNGIREFSPQLQIIRYTIGIASVRHGPFESEEFLPHTGDLGASGEVEITAEGQESPFGG